MQLLIIRVDSKQSSGGTTSGLHCIVGVKVLEYQSVIPALLAHEVELLAIVVFDIHCRACIVSTDVVGLNKVG